MAYKYDCEECKKHYEINTKFLRGEKTICPICALGEEGKQAKYHETSQAKNAGHPEGFRYPDDTSKYKYNWNGKKWVNKDGKTREEKANEK